jgi:hypothetical protein
MMPWERAEEPQRCRTSLRPRLLLAIATFAAALLAAAALIGKVEVPVILYKGF